MFRGVVGSSFEALVTDHRQRFTGLMVALSSVMKLFDSESYSDFIESLSLLHAQLIGFCAFHVENMTTASRLHHHHDHQITLTIKPHTESTLYSNLLDNFLFPALTIRVVFFFCLEV